MTSRRRTVNHPLLNRASASYYTLPDGTTAIELMERTLTVAEMRGWCAGSLFKYEFRLDRKGQKESDKAKIVTFEEYVKLLADLPTGTDNLTVTEAYQVAGIDIIYDIGSDDEAA